MKVFLANIFYFVGAIAWTYGFQWILILWIGGLRFTAADGPPGDISMGSKLVYSVGFPLFHFVLLTVGLLLYSYILRNFSIKFKKNSDYFQRNYYRLHNMAACIRRI